MIKWTKKFFLFQHYTLYGCLEWREKLKKKSILRFINWFSVYMQVFVDLFKWITAIEVLFYDHKRFRVHRSPFLLLVNSMLHLQLSRTRNLIHMTETSLTQEYCLGLYNLFPLCVCRRNTKIFQNPAHTTQDQAETFSEPQVTDVKQFPS